MTAEYPDAGSSEPATSSTASSGRLLSPEVAVGSAEHPRGGSEVGTAERGDVPDMLSAWVAAAAADEAARNDPANARPKLQPFDPFPDPPTGPPGLWAELKRREIFQGIAVYALIAFGVLHALDAIIPALGLPIGMWRGSLIVAAAGLPVAMAIDWFYDLTPEGVRREVSAGHVGFAARPARWPRILAVIAVGFVLAIVSFGAYLRLFAER